MDDVTGGANSLVGYCSYLHATIIRVKIDPKHGRIKFCICVSKLCRNSHTRACNIFYRVGPKQRKEVRNTFGEMNRMMV